MSGRRLIVVGAGPIGVAAALGALRRGYDVQVLERAEVGASLRRWGPTRFFSPLAMNLPPEAGESVAGQLPAGEAVLTGPEFADRVLLPLARAPALAGRILEGHGVLSVQRDGMLRGDYPGHPLRGERGFRLLVETPAGERFFEADAVLDASGTQGQPVSLGIAGERAASARWVRDLGALDGRRPELAGKRVLLLGDGHSAANALGVFEAMARESPELRVVWAVRGTSLRPCSEVARDPLPERQRVVGRANDLAQRPPPWLRMERRATATEVAAAAGGAQRVSFTGPGSRTVEADAVVALTGYRPDLSFLSELALELAPATEGAGRLARALSHVTDCLSVPRVSPADLASGEPGFHLVGAKSYGRAQTFLLQTGYAQLDTILDSLGASSA